MALGGWPRRALALVCLLVAAIAAVHKNPSRIVAGDHAGSAGRVLVAARDLAAGTPLSGRNVRLATVPADVVPDGAVGSVAAGAGRVLAAPVRRGEPITDARLLGPGLATGLAPPETRAVPVRLADGQTASLLRPGDRIDLFATPVDTGFPAAPTSTGPPTEPRPDAVPGQSQTDPSTRSGPAGAGGSGGGPTGGRQPSGRAEQASDGLAGATLLAGGVRVLAVLVEEGLNLTDGVLVVVAASDWTARQLAAAGAQMRLSVAIRPP